MKQLTQSQKIRWFIKLNWIADEPDMSFEEYYKEKTDKYIKILKDKLKEKELFMEEMKDLAKDYE